MSWQASGWVKKCRARSPTHKLVLLVTADYSTDKAGAIGLAVPDGWAVCWAGIDEIAADCGVAPRTVMRVFADLERDGFIRRDRRNARNPRVGQPGQPATIRTTDAVWINYSQPYVTAPPNEAKRAAKARAGQAGGKAAAARRAAERDATRAAHKAAAAAVVEALADPREPVPQVTVCPPLSDNVLGPQVTPSVTAEPSGNLQVTDNDRAALVTHHRAGARETNPEPDVEVDEPEPPGRATTRGHAQRRSRLRAVPPNHAAAIARARVEPREHTYPEPLRHDAVLA